MDYWNYIAMTWHPRPGNGESFFEFWCGDDGWLHIPTRRTLVGFWAYSLISDRLQEVSRSRGWPVRSLQDLQARLVLQWRLPFSLENSRARNEVKASGRSSPPEQVLNTFPSCHERNVRRLQK